MMTNCTLGCATLAEQTALSPMHTPELAVARQRCIDYFEAQKCSRSLFAWEKCGKNGLDQGTKDWVDMICVRWPVSTP